MKHLILTSLLITGFLSHPSKAQDVIRQLPCTNESIMQQADSVKEDFSKKGFLVVKETSISMESEYEMPIIVPLTQGTWYQFVFIGEMSSRLYEVRMYDWNEREVIYKKNLWGDVDGNIISYLYIPAGSEFHMIKTVQVNKKKKKGLCGYVMLLKKVR
jgi:hypothetical protein